MQIIKKLLATPRLEVRPIVDSSSRSTTDMSLNKHDNAYDRYNYNIKNDVLNTPDGFTKEAVAELAELRANLATALGVPIEYLNARNKEGLLSGPSRIKVSLSNTGLVLRPMERPEDLIKAAILLSNSGQIAFSIEDMQKKSRCAYLVTEPDATINTSADEFAIKKQLMEQLLKVDTKEKQQGILELMYFYSGSTNRMAPDLSQKLIDAKYNEVLESYSKTKLLLAVITDKDLDVKLKLVDYIYKGLIKYKIGEGYKIPNSDVVSKSFDELFKFLTSIENTKLLGALNELSLTGKKTNK